MPEHRSETPKPSELTELPELKLPKQTFMVFRERSKEWKEKPQIMQVYDWASWFVAENMPHRLAENYYMTEPVKRLLFKLEHVKGGLLGLVGLQGSGKTTAIRELYHKLKAERPDHVTAAVWDNSAYNYFMERPYVGWRKLVKGNEAEPKILFIDMSDYSKRSRSVMHKHLDQIRDLWLKTRKHNLTIVVAIQREMFRDHFLFGKIDAVMLEPLKPAELVEAYQQIWETPEPFTPEALLLIAQLSRGIFRRFMKYIQACIERHMSKGTKGLIGRELVNTTITLDQLVKDMDLELSDIFKRADQKLEAVKLLDYLREQEANQKQIAEGIGLSEATVSRLVRKLEAHDYGYVSRSRDAHGQWIVKLKW